MNNIPLEKIPSIDYSNGGTVSLPASWITAINALIAAGGGVSGLTAGRLPYVASATSLADSANATLDANGAILVRYLSLKSSAAGLNDIGAILDSTAAQKWAFQLGASQELIIQDFVNNKNVIKLTPAATPTITLLGNLKFNTDNAYDIGASGANRPKDIYVAGSGTFGGGLAATGNVACGGGQLFFWNGRSIIASPSDGVITLLNAAQSDFTRLQFGGTTASFGSIKRNGANLDFRFADDSGFCGIRGLYELSGTSGASLSVGYTSGTAFTARDTGRYNWVNNGDCTTGTMDTGLIRVSAGVVGVGNGASGDVSGTLQATNILVGAGLSGAPSLRIDSASHGFSRGASQGGNALIATISGTDVFAIIQAGYGILATTGYLFSSAISSAADAGLTRVSAGVIGVGTGAAASIAGTLQLAKIITGSGSAAGSITLTSTSVSGVYCNINTSSQVANDVGYNLSFVGAITGEMLPAYWQASASLGFPFRHTNSDNTNATAHCYHRITVGGGSGGDAFTRFEVSGVTDWSIGIDNSNNDCLTIGPNADPSTGTAALTIHPTTYLLTLKDAMHITLGSGTGTKLGTATGEKLGFWGVSPVVQQVLATGAAHTVDDVITMLQTLGLCKQS